MNKLIVLPPLKALLLSLLVTLTACGGGGGGGGGGSTPSNSISGDSSGTDNGSGTVSGKLSVSGGDSFVAVEDAPADYGSFTVSTSGSWTYDVDSSNPSVVALPADVTATENIAVSTVGGLTETIRVTVVGVNDAPEIGTGVGVDSMSISADATDSVAGILTIDDPDTGESVFEPQTNTVGTYGLFSIAESGAWTYTLSSVSVSSVANVNVSGIIDDNDTFAVVSADGTQHNVVVTVTGISDEEPADPAEVVTPSEPTDIAEVIIESADDDGGYNVEDGQGPDNAIDGDITDASRWSYESAVGAELELDLGNAQTVGALQIMWYKGDERAYSFNISVLADMDDNTQEWVTVFDNIQDSSGVDDTYEIVNFTQLYSASQIKVVGYGNNENDWNNVIEVEVYNKNLTEVIEPEDPTEGTSPGDIVATPEGTPSDLLDYDHIDAGLSPSDNFDLSYWYLSVPTDTDDNEKSDSISIIDLSNGYENSDFFYTGSDGGMVFKTPIDGYKTSTNTTYTRTELRELVSKSDSPSKSDLSNNWVFSTAPLSVQQEAGGVDGTMKATLAVNHVTEIIENYTENGSEKTSEYRVGRVVIGQIHAKDDEPIRLYYQKLPSNDKGSIYFAHEPAYDVEDEVWVEVIGERGSGVSNPSDGIALDEVFSYEINVTGNTLTLSIMREGKDTITTSISMNGSNYDVADDYMYFKAGLYMADKLAYDYDDYATDPDLNDARADEYSEVTFYALEVTH